MKTPKLKLESPSSILLDSTLTVETNIPQTVVFLLKATEDELILSACHSLLRFARGTESNRVLLYQCGAVPLLLKHVQHANRDIRRLAAMTLTQMNENCSVQDQLLTEENARQLVSILANQKDCVLVEFASTILHTLCSDTIGKASLLAYGALEPLVHQLQSSDADVLNNCLGSLVELLDDVQATERFLQSDGIASTLRNLFSEYPVLQRQALTLLRKSMDYEDGRRRIRQAGGLSDLVKLLKDSNYSDLHRSVISVLQAAIADPLNSHELHRIGGLLQLLHMLENSMATDIQIGCGECIAQMARNREISQLLHSQGINRLLVNVLLSSQNARCQSAGALAIRWMAQTLRSQQELIDLDAVPRIASLVDNIQATQATAQALAALTAHSQPACQQLAACEQLGPLLDKLAADDEETVTHVAAVVRNLAEDVEIRAKLVESGSTVECLSDCLRSNSRHVVIAACQALGVLCLHTRVRQQMAERNEVRTLVSLLRGQLEDVREEAVALLLIMCSDIVLAEQFCSEGGVEIICRLRYTNLLHVALHTNLSGMYSLTGRLEHFHLTYDGFFDSGRQPDCQTVLYLAQELDQPISPYRVVFLLNSGLAPLADKSGQGPEDKKISIASPLSATASVVSPKKLKDKDDKDKESALNEDNSSPPVDARLRSYLEYARRTITPNLTDKVRIQMLAELVSSRLGGNVSRRLYSQWSAEAHINTIKRRRRSNVIPIGDLERGDQRCRALLFKFLADQLGVGCSLERGSGGHHWNCVEPEPILGTGSVNVGTCVVDLMHVPGRLLPWRSYDASVYMGNN